MYKHGNMGKFTQKELVEILNKYGTLSDNEEESILDKTLTSLDKKHEIKVSEIWDVPFNNKISFTIMGTDEEGTYEVNEGTTWEDFFKSLSKKGRWFYTNKDESISYYRYETERYLYYCFFVDMNENKINRSDSIKMRNI